MPTQFVGNHVSSHAGVTLINRCPTTVLLHPARVHNSSAAVRVQSKATDVTCSEQSTANQPGHDGNNAFAQGRFQPRLLTHRLQKAERVEQLQQLWEAHNQQFNSIHFSALMKQLEKLHAAAQAGQYAGSNSGSHGDAVTESQLSQQWLGNRISSTRRRKQQPTSAIATAGQHTLSTTQRQELPAGGLPSWPQPQQQQHELAALSGAEQQSGHDAAQHLARSVARTALRPEHYTQLDGRALVMITHSLAKLGVAESDILHDIVQATGLPLLRQLDAQQVTNLIWSVSVCTLQGRKTRFGRTSSMTNSNPSSTGRPSTDSSSATRLHNPQQHLRPANSGRMFQLPHSWLLLAADALQEQLAVCDSAGLAMALWGFAQLGFRPDDSWWCRLWSHTQGKLAGYSGQDLSALMYACGKLKVRVPDEWLSSWLSASCAVLPSLSPQQLTMCLWGLATAGCQPDKAWLMLWFLESKSSLHKATTQDLSLWLYSLAVLRITPSPLWCTSFVEASFDRFTAAHTPPQELSTAMWAISCMSWSPPLLFWRGLLEAAAAGFSRFNPHDLANCISAATVVDVNSIEKSWFTAFLQASEPKLSAFLPVQLAHTAKALAAILKAHDWACLCIQASWQTAFIQAAAAQLAQGGFSQRNLERVVDGMKQFMFNPATEEARAFLRVAEARLEKSKPTSTQQLQPITYK